MTARRTLTIDAGNSRVKATLFIGNLPTDSRTEERGRLSHIEAFCLECGAHEVVYSAVGMPLPEEFLRRMEAMAGGRMLKLTHETPLPVRIDYATPQTLGLDRVAAAAGAQALFPGEAVLIVDAGTAATIDILDKDGTFRGGRISPGLSLRFRSLHEYTAALPMINANGALPEFGYDTSTSIRSGVVKGLAAEIKETLRSAKQMYGVKRMILSGGDAETLLPHLYDETESVNVIPDIVGHGLLSIHSHNSFKS